MTYGSVGLVTAFNTRGPQFDPSDGHWNWSSLINLGSDTIQVNDY